ncbi:Ribonuclease H domain [Dillenia turbinata]|uniref:Ribonuclease H domain n=1 Tax=Dillenia turbinata TaxID=194707 RepID=A0AAN8UZ74_9MAGN
MEVQRQLAAWFLDECGQNKRDTAELWALREGLSIAKRKKFGNLIIESDSLVLVKAINEGVGANQRWRNMISECKILLKELGASKINHIFRNTNMCTDKLAEIGKSAAAGAHEEVNPPVAIRGLLQADASGVSFFRRKRVAA